MKTADILQLSIYSLLLLIVAYPLGSWLATVLDKKNSSIINCHDALLKKVVGAEQLAEMSWKKYAQSVLLFSVISIGVTYLVLRFQNLLPLNTRSLPGMTADAAFNTAVSFVTNTNWQMYSGEASLSVFSQMVGLTVQNFVSAAVGIAVLAALARGLNRKESKTIGNFWVDLSRITILFLIPLSVAVATFLCWQGVPQTFNETVLYTAFEKADDAPNTIVLGPIASQVAIKQLGTNGGGYFNANSAHPLENPTPLSNLIQCLAILAIPAACVFAFGQLVGDKRQGWAICIAMFILFFASAVATMSFERAPNYTTNAQSIIAADPTDAVAGGNMEGKEVRFGVGSSALWAVATTAASNGSVNSMHDSYTPFGGMIPMVLMQLGEVVFGGVGSGLYGMFAFIIVTVLIAGLMVGRTPEYLGKKIEPFEMKMVSLIVLIPCLLALAGTAVTIGFDVASQSVSNPGAHGFSQILYAYSSMANNNGSAFGGFGSGLPFHTLAGGIVMFVSRFWLAIPVIALAGSFAAKKQTPVSAGTLPTHTTLFITLVLGVILIVGALTFIPALVLGPVVEHLL